ncbi:ATP-binding protein [Mycolicibacterium sp.]|uniref:BbrUII/HgiDII family restriction enzyme n=1 Tax=Mycolicibacterium sp. TaxID=2320850 RepID=UPI0037C697FA
MTDADRKFRMTVDLSVLEALGINLYSNAAAVLSELVANAWDADSSRVEIDWDTGNDRVTVSDTGTGMSVEDINSRFLKVGYAKRTSEGAVSPRWGRPYMGRKGIGKLSVFSIADVVEVYSTKDSRSIGLRIEIGALRNAMKAGKEYNPDEITPVPEEYVRAGTTIVLSSLKKSRADLTAAALRKRLARRFDVVDQTPEDQGGFKLFIDGKPVTYADRQELKKLQFIWEIGEKRLEDRALPSDVKRFVIEDNIVDTSAGWEVKGWIGTAKTPTDLTDDEDAGSLKNIIVIARKRPIQEGIIEKLDFSRLFGNYVTGQIEADFLDLDEFDDIATSDRQRLIEDDPRVIALQKYLRKVFLDASEQWAEERPSKESKNAIDRYPQVKSWLESLPSWQRKPATAMIGNIAGLALEGTNAEKNRRALFRSGILAFARVGLRQSVEELSQLSRVTVEDLLPVLTEQSSYEAALFVDILRTRLSAIEKMREISDANEKEKVLQRHLFDHLWLLDPSWERATGSERIEEDLRRVEPGSFALDEDEKEVRGRIDIRYRTTGGRHVIVELKRYERAVKVGELAEQGRKYADALYQVLSETNRENEGIEVVFVLGKKPTAARLGFKSDDEQIKQELDIFNGSYILYDTLIGNARRQYSEYLEASDKAKELDQLLGSFNDDELTDVAG